MAGTTASQGRPAGLARDEKGRAVDVHKFKAAVLGNTKRRSLAEAEPALMQALVAVDNDGGAALQEYLEKEHIECQNGKDGSTLLPEAMRAKARVPRDVTYVYKEMNSVGLQYGPKFSMLQDVYMTPEAALH